MAVTAVLFPKTVFFAREIERRGIDHVHAHFVWIEGVDFDEEHLELVLIRKRTWSESLRRLLDGAELVVLESAATAKRLS